MKTLSQRMREAGFMPRRQIIYAENGDVIPSWGYTYPREQLFNARQELVAALTDPVGWPPPTPSAESGDGKA